MKHTQKQWLKNIVPMAGISSLAFFFSAAVVFADAPKEIPDTINLNIQASHADIEGLPKDKKSVKNFTHKKHADEYVKGNSKHAAVDFSDDFTCAACHTEAKTSEDIVNSAPDKRLLAGLQAKGGPAKVKKYFHDICLKCHKSMKKAKKDTGPTKCNDCHSRK